METQPANAGEAEHEVNQTVGVAGWTLVSRVSGLARVIVAGATLGPTFFANIFQATNTVPNLTYNLLAGSLLTTLMVPTLVHALEEEGLERGRKLARRLFGVITAGFCAAAVLVVLAGPVLVRLLTLGLRSSADAGAAQRVCWILLLLVVPQIVLYGMITVGIAAQNARHHFSLAAAAPAIENIGLILTLVVAAWYFGPVAGDSFNDGYAVFLGVGATLSVLAHAGVQLYGAARAGMPLWPEWDWKDSAVRDVVRRMVPATGTAMLDAAWIFALTIAAGTVAGGVVAVQMALNFYNLPIALSARAAGSVMLPRLARDFVLGNLQRFRATFAQGMSWAWFVAAPASLLVLFFARPIADSLAFGELRSGDGVTLLAVSLATFALALLPAASNEFARSTCYARNDILAPLRGGAALLAVTLVGLFIAVVNFDGAATLAVIGLSVTVSELVRSFIVGRAAVRDTTSSDGPLKQHFVRHVLVALVTIGPAAILGNAIASVLGTHAGALLGLAIGGCAALVLYVGVQTALEAPEVPPGLRRRIARVQAGGLNDSAIIVIALAATVLVSILAVFVGPMALAVPVLAAGIAGFVMVVRRPVWAAYIFLATLPFLGGIDRGVLIPLMRPSEFVQFGLVAAVVVGALYRGARGEQLRIQVTRLDIAILTLALVASVWPLCWMLLRGQVPTSSDVFSTVVLWRLGLLYVLFRWVVRTSAELRRCLWILLTTSCLLAVLAVLDGRGYLKLPGIWTPNVLTDSTGRGGATLNSSIAVGDYLAYAMAVALMWLLVRPQRRVLLGCIAAALVLGSFGTGQFSAWFAMIIVVIVVVRSDRRFTPMVVKGMPVAIVAAVLAWPVVATRLAGFSGGDIPSSWRGRIDNITNAYIPRMSGFRWVLGVRPDSVLVPLETWRAAIYLESGWLWLFFVGGIPLFLAFIYFCVRSFAHTYKVTDGRTDDVAVAAIAARGALWSIVILGFVDMHFTLRGGGDLFFILLGLSANRLVPRPEPSPAENMPAENMPAENMPAEHMEVYA